MDLNTRRALLARTRHVDCVIRTTWPFRRLLIASVLTPRCKQCALSAKASPLDASGTCEICRTTNASGHAAGDSVDDESLRSELAAALNSLAGTGRGAYDALVFVSGGKDSAYLLARLKREYPTLRLLAITIDNGFMSPVALENVETTVGVLGVDHYIVRLAHSLHTKLFRYAFTHLPRQGAAYAIDVLDGELRFDIGRSIAAALKIPLALIGFSRAQILTYTGAMAVGGDHALELVARSHLAGYPIDALGLTQSERAQLWDPSRYSERDIARILFPLAVWNENEVVVKADVVARGLIPPRQESPLVTNHLLIPLMAAADIARQGYSSYEPEFSSMIRSGKADRDYWRSLFEIFEYSVAYNTLLGPSIDTLCNEIGVAREEFALRS